MIFDERAHCLKSTLKKGMPTEDDIFKYLVRGALLERGRGILCSLFFFFLADHLQEDANATRVYCDDRFLY